MATCIQCGQEIDAVARLKLENAVLEERLDGAEARAMSREEADAVLKTAGIDPDRVMGGLVGHFGQQFGEASRRVAELEAVVSHANSLVLLERKRADDLEAALRSVGALVASLKKVERERVKRLCDRTRELLALPFGSPTYEEYALEVMAAVVEVEKVAA
jgi:hypothetical protein